MVLFSRSTAFSRVTALAARRQVHAAFAWMHNNPRTIMDWQTRLVSIPAPPFGEVARAAWISECFIKAGLSEVSTDATGNVIAIVPATHLPAESSGPVVVLSAHLDTVFPADTLINAKVVENDGCLRLEAPGASDNGAGVAGMLALAHALIHAEIELPVPLVVIGNVGEEGEGDLRGVRHFYDEIAFWRAASPPTSFSTAPEPTRPSRRPWAAGAFRSTSAAPAATALPTQAPQTPSQPWPRRLPSRRDSACPTSRARLLISEPFTAAPA